MKKPIMIFSFILTLVLMCGLIFTNTSFTNKKVYAKGLDSGHIIVVGKGEVEAQPDTIRVSFSLKCKAETMQAGQAKMRESIKAVTEKITQYNKDAVVYTNYSSSFPVFEGGLLGYEFDSCLIATSPNVEDANGLVDAVVEAGATSVHSVNYLLENKDEAYIKALKLAKQNAEDKANAIYGNLTLKGLKEEAVYNYCEGRQNEKIKISAKVTAFYVVNSQNLENNETASLKNALSEKSSSTTSAQTKQESLVKKESSLNNKKQNLTESNENKESLNTSVETSSNKEIRNEETNKLTDTTSSEINKQTLSETANKEVNQNKLTNSKQTKTNASESASKNTSKEISKTNEPLSIIDANGNVVLEII